MDRFCLNLLILFLGQVRDQTGHELEVEVRGQEARALMGQRFRNEQQN